MPNADHSLRGSDAQESILAFYQAILTRRAMPKFSWEMAKDGSIRVQTEDKPNEVNLWQATNPKARDFRLEADRQGLQEVAPRADARRGLRRQGRQAGDRVDGVLRGAGVRQRREGAVQVHDAGAASCPTYCPTRSRRHRSQRSSTRMESSGTDIARKEERFAAYDNWLGPPTAGAIVMERRAIHIRGIVQGVGFRPFVYHLATRHQLAGW